MSLQLHLDFRAFQLSSSLLLPFFIPPLGEERGRELCSNLHIGMRLEVFFVVTTVANEGENFMGNINYSWHKLFKYFSIALTIANCNQNLWQIQAKKVRIPFTAHTYIPLNLTDSLCHPSCNLCVCFISLFPLSCFLIRSLLQVTNQLSQ